MTTTPVRAGTRITFGGVIPTRYNPGLAESVGIPIIHDWGPEEDARLITSSDEFDALFGDSDTAGRRAVLDALRGQGITTEGNGAGGVWVFRMVGAAGAKATKALQNTTPATALTLTAKYAGVRGNDLSVTVLLDPRDSNRHILKLFYKGVLQETFTYAKTDIAAAAATINAGSNLVTAVSNVTGTALAVVSAQAFASGNSGTTLLSADWVAAMTAFEYKKLSIVAPYDLTDDTIRATFVAWVQTQVAAMRPVFLVVGGAAGETLDTAIARSQAINDPHVINLGVGSFIDDANGGAVVSTSQLAPRIAGVLAARGEEASITFADLADLRLSGASGPTNDEVIDALRFGVVVLTQTESDNDDVTLHVERGISTYTTDTDLDRPLNIWSEVQMVRGMDIFLREFKKWGDDIVIGKLPVDDRTRNMIRAEGQRRLRDREARSLAQPGSTFFEVVATTTNEIPFNFGWKPIFSVTYLNGNGRIG